MRLNISFEIENGSSPYMFKPTKSDSFSTWTHNNQPKYPIINPNTIVPNKQLQRKYHIYLSTRKRILKTIVLYDNFKQNPSTYNIGQLVKSIFEPLPWSSFDPYWPLHS